MAAKASNLAPAQVYTSAPKRRGSRVPTLVWLLLVVAALVGGVYLGHEVLSDHVSFGQLRGTTTLIEEQLDDVVATYVLDGETHQVTAREAIAQEASLDALRNSDGTYVMPSAESVLSAVRTAVLMREVETRGIEVSDEEYVAYVVETFGTNSAEELASAYNMDVETVRARLRESAAIARLRSEVVTASATEPTPPSAPEEGSLDATSADYAAYIIGLVGDEWDSEKGYWADEESPYAVALREFDVSADSASYGAAQAAYNLAYQRYSASNTSASTEWTDFVNDKLCGVSLALSSIVS